MTRYDTDWYAWVHEQAQCLEEGRWDALDVPHLVEELELMAESAPGELYNRLIVLLAHLLKLAVAAEVLPGVYDRAQRLAPHLPGTAQGLARLLDCNPRLTPTVPDEVTQAYEVARLQALAALQIREDQLPIACPWTADEVQADDFWPDVPVG